MTLQISENYGFFSSYYPIFITYVKNILAYKKKNGWTNSIFANILADSEFSKFIPRYKFFFIQNFDVAVKKSENTKNRQLSISHNIIIKISIHFIPLNLSIYRLKLNN